MFEEHLNKPGRRCNIDKQNPHESIKKLIEEQYFEYAFLMRLVDTVMPSASLLSDVKNRKALEVGADPDEEKKK